MTPAHLIEALRTESAALLDACTADPDAPVPSCPGWHRAQLLAHTGMAQAWHLAQVEAGPTERVRYSSVPPAPQGDALYVWFATGADALARALSDLDDHTIWTTWAGPQPSSFFPRRMALETAVHRWDAAPGPLPADLAVAGIDELLEVFTRLLPPDRLGGADGTIHLHATDEELTDGGEWLVAFGPEGITSRHGHAKGDVALRGRASDLFLWTWNRVPIDGRFEVFGDAELLDVWATAVVF